MEYKVLVSINVPSLETKFDVYIPVNRKVYNVINMFKTTLFELSLGSFDVKKDYIMYNALTGAVYDMNMLIRDTDIRNGSSIILL